LEIFFGKASTGVGSDNRRAASILALNCCPQKILPSLSRQVMFHYIIKDVIT
jgi:hypothetical protein